MEAIPAAVFRRGVSSRINPKTDTYALTAWCIRVLALARNNSLNGIHGKGTVSLKFMREIAKLSYFDNGPLLAKEYLEKNGIHLIFVSHLPKTYLDGAAMRRTDGRPVIGMTLRYDRLDNFWFCLLHELAHVARHLTSSDAIIIDDLDLRGHEAEAEALAVGLDARIEAVTQKAADAGLVSVFYEVDGTDPTAPWTTGAGTFQDVLIGLVGGENIAADIAGWGQMSLEEIVTRDPQVVIFGEGSWVPTTVESYSDRSGWGEIAAVVDDRVYGIDTNWVDRPGPRLVDALEEMALMIHPELFE